MSACVDCGCDVGGESVANDFPMCRKCGEWYADEHAADARREQARCDKLCVVCLAVECEDGGYICDGCAFDEGVKASELDRAAALIREAVEGYREHGERLPWVWHGPGRARVDLVEAAKHGPEDAGIADVFDPRRWLWGWMFSAVIREVDKLARYGSSRA